MLLLLIILVSCFIGYIMYLLSFTVFYWIFYCGKYLCIKMSKNIILIGQRLILRLIYRFTVAINPITGGPKLFPPDQYPSVFETPIPRPPEGGTTFCPGRNLVFKDSFYYGEWGVKIPPVVKTPIIYDTESPLLQLGRLGIDLNELSPIDAARIQRWQLYYDIFGSTAPLSARMCVGAGIILWAAYNFFYRPL